MAFWSKLGNKEKNQIIGLTVAVIVGCYAFFWQIDNRKKLVLLENRINMNKGKMKPTGKHNTNNKTDVSYNEISQLQSKAEKAQKQLAELKQQQQRRRAFFVPLDDNQAIQELRLSILSLAESHGIYISAVSEIGSHIDKEKGLQEGLELEESQLDTNNLFARPLLGYRVKCRFSNLQRFLKNLERLRYTVAPVRLNIEAITVVNNDGKQEVVSPESQFLNVDLVLSL